ncbi:LPXTG cell wall anchor domain-containing protein [Bdellovibrio sp.]|uniref:LPXTG cell wall anchor domain-containing protein n=1 Tax=Bdellovibrio TaxID=958 RepID=UPI003221E931
MMKKLVVLLACLGLAFQVTSCTSKDSQADSEVAADFDSADLEKLEGDEALEIAGDDSLASDQLPEDALGESTTTTETTTTTTETTVADGEATTEHTDVATTTETLPADPFAEQPDVASTTPPPVETSTSVAQSETSSSVFESSSTSESSTTVVDSGASEAPKKASAPLQKVATTPWKAGGTWYNTVYFARPGDTLKSVSQMIYGSDKRAELKKGNPTYHSRDVRAGDKVYYNSPHRPEDSARMITYYEDNGLAPETYVAKSGDNIRKVSKTLLGYDNAWKEVWASNSVDSKGEIAEGTELRYWRGGAVAAAPVPQQHQEVAAAMPEQAPPPMQEEIPAPPMPEDPMAHQAQMDIPPPPPMDQAGDMAPPPPPDMAQEMAPPPPPPVEAINPPAPQVAEEAPTGMDNDTTMALAVVGLAAAGLAVLIVMRKKRKQKELEQQAMDNTHVGT